MKRKLLRLASLVGLCFGAGGLNAFSPTNFSLPHDEVLWKNSAKCCEDSEEGSKIRLNIGAGFEYGLDGGEGRNKDNTTVDVFQIYGNSESVLSLLVNQAVNNSSVASQIIGLTNVNLLTTPGSNGTTTFSGDVALRPQGSQRDQTMFNINAVMNLPVDAIPGTLDLRAFVPFYRVDTHGTNFVADETAANTGIPNGALSYMTVDAINSLLAKEGRSFSTSSSFNDTVLGDVTILLEWANQYNQVNDALSSIGIRYFTGLSLPTSKKFDLKDLLALPVGNDNSLGIELGAGIDLNFARNFRISGSVDGSIYLGEDSERRVKTVAGEGELLIGNTMNINTKPGTRLRFSAGSEWTSDCKRFSVGAMYQFTRKSEDRYNSNDPRFVKSIADSAEYAQEKVCHNMIIRGLLDFGEMVESRFKPKLTISYKHPFKAQRMVVYKTLSMNLCFCF